MSTPEEALTLAALAPSSVATHSPVFAEPWQAQAFALVVGLQAAGAFSWAEWTTALTSALTAAEGRTEADDGSRYHEHWLTALESLVAQKGLAAPAALAKRKAAWAEAYRRTPHGHPISL